MSPETSRSAKFAALEAAWPEVSRRVYLDLQCTGARRTSAEDIVQKVALRAMLSGVEFEDAADLLPWALTVARNLRISEYRDAQHLTCSDGLDLVPARVNVADEAEWRDALRQAATVIAKMPQQDRRTLIGIFDSYDRASGPEPGRISVRRHRARNRLGIALGSATALALTVAILPSTPQPLPDSVTTVISPAMLATQENRVSETRMQPHASTSVSPRTYHPATPQPLLCVTGPVFRRICTPQLAPSRPR